MRFPDLEALRRAVIGNPLPSSAHHEERYSNAEALAILSSDALSSVAYATQEIVLVLGMAGAAALRFTLPITGLIVGLMVIVATSYRQTIKAYPHGGGSYRVPLVILDSPFRSLVEPVVEFVQQFETDHRKDRHRFCMIVLPVFVTRHRWENLLHNQSTILLRQALRERGTRVVTTVGFYL